MDGQMDELISKNTEREEPHASKQASRQAKPETKREEDQEATFRGNSKKQEKKNETEKKIDISPPPKPGNAFTPAQLVVVPPSAFDAP